MSFLDTVTNPGKAISDGWHAVTDVASSASQKLSEAVQKPIDFTKGLVNTAIDGTAKFVSSVTNIDADKIKGAISAIGTVITNPVKALVQGVSAGASLSTDAQAIVKNISSVALLTSPLGAGLALTQVATDKWMSADKKVSVEKVDSFKDNKDALEFSGLWDIYDKQKDGATDATAPAAAAAQTEVTNPTEVKRTGDKAEEHAETRSYTNANGERAEVKVTEGKIEYTSTKDGQVVTQASQTAEQSTLTHKGETATLETKTGKLEFTSEQVRVLQQNANAEVQLKDGRRVLRKDGVLQLFDASGHLLQELEANLIKIGTDIKMYGRGTNLDAKADETAAAAAAENKDAINVLVTTDGDAMAMLPDGSRIQLRKDGNAIMKLSNGQVVLVEGSGKVLILKDGEFEEINGEKASEVTAQVTEGRMQLQNGRIAFNGGSVDLKQREIEFRNAHQETRHIKVQTEPQVAAPTGIIVKTPEQTVVAAADNSVKTTDTAGNTTTTSDITKPSVETPFVTVSPDAINVKHSDGTPDTVISSTNEVTFRGNDGPKLHKDGSMKLDEQTETDAEGNVRSGSWHASAGGAFGGSFEASIQFQGKAIAVSMNAQDHAASIRDRALRGKVTYSDVAALNNDLGNVTALINQLAAAGCVEYIPQLQSSCSALIETLNIAAPRAAQQAA